MTIPWKSFTHEEKVKRARIRTYKRSPFFSLILLHMNMQADEKNEKLPYPTMGVDADGNLTYSPEFVDELSEEELIGVMCHEVLHIALMHLTRLRMRNPEVFNIANDLIVNDILVNDRNKTYTLPTKFKGMEEASPLIPNYNHSYMFPKLGVTIEKINEKSSEELYDELFRVLPKEKGCSCGSGTGKDSNGKDGKCSKCGGNMNMPKGFDIHGYGKPGESSTEATKKAQKWRKIISEAASLAKQRGQLPSGIERRIGSLLEPKANWKQLLYKYIVAQVPFDYTWSRPSKRGIGANVYLPTVVKESVQIAVSIDTSGSIGKDELRQFLSELVGIVNVFPNINIDLMICDAKVHETYELSGADVDELLKLKMSGGGGTSHRPVYKYVEEHIPTTRVLINFTDGYTDFPNDDYSFDTIWVIDKNGCNPKHIPFGEVIKIE